MKKTLLLILTCTLFTGFIFAQTGNVGIGTTSPAEKLDVNGNTVIGNGNTGDNTLYLRRADGNPTIMGLRSNSANRLDLFNSSGSGELLLSVNGGNIKFGQGGATDLTTEIMRINIANQRVGILTPSPDEALDVSGNVIIGDGAGGNNSLLLRRISDGTGSAGLLNNATQQLEVFNYAGTREVLISSNSGNILFGNNSGATGLSTEVMRINTSSGNVGIGTPSPSATLDVDGSAIFNESAGDNDFRIETASLSNAFFVDASANEINFIGDNTVNNENKVRVFPQSGRIWYYRKGHILKIDPANGGAANDPVGVTFDHTTGATAPTGMVLGRTDLSLQPDPQLFLSSNGRIGIRTDNPSTTLDVNGSVNCTGGSCSSDRRWKTDIQPLENVTERIQKINGVTYFWNQKDFQEKNFNDRKQIGVIAQEVEAVFPELVNTDAAGFKSMDYQSLTAVLLEGLKEQNNEIEALKAQLNALESQNSSLSKDMEVLKAAVSELQSNNHQ